MKRLISFLCVLCLMALWAIPCHAAVAVLRYWVEDDQAVITGIESPYEIALTIPEEIEGYPVTKIGNAAFSHCTVLSEIVLPDTITVIADDAFVGCTALRSVVFSENLHTIEEDAFSDCISLPEIALPASLKTIGNFAFSNCSNLKTVNIPEGVTSMGIGAFCECTGLTEISLPGSLTVIEAAAFASCSGLEKVHLGEGIQQISDTAFVSCSGLKELTIPASVTQVGAMIVTYTGVEKIYFRGDAPSFSDDSFFQRAATAYYPAGNETWTIDVKRHYGGNITWVEYNPLPAMGDVTGDGRINVGDVSKLYAHVRKTAQLTGDALAVADVARNGIINIGDVSKLYAVVKKTVSLS